jgi:predicted AAA+ superfamily ATPase
MTLLTPDGYKKRMVDGTIDDYLRAFGAVYVRGPKYCGKTWTSRNHANSETSFQSSSSAKNIEVYRNDPTLALSGERPHLIDEWQEIPEVWNAVRRDVDNRAAKGSYILCGSSVPTTDGTMHSGIGRIGDVNMRTMSLFESGDSDGSVSLSQMFTEGTVRSKLSETRLEKLAELIIRGGWPDLIGIDLKSAIIRNREYLRKSIEDDIPRMANASIDLLKMRMFIKSLARNESTIASDRKIIRNMQDNDGNAITPVTLAKYREYIDRLFLTADQAAFSCNIRSSVRVGKSPKRHLIDPSLAAAALEITPEKLIDDPKTFGFLFEALCERDLDIYSTAQGGRLFHYRDENGKEIDAVVEMSDGKWGAFEIKLGTEDIDNAAKKLLKITETFEKRPAITCIISGLVGGSYRRDDGVLVIPITSLRD